MLCFSSSLISKQKNPKFDSIGSAEIHRNFKVMEWVRGETIGRGSFGKVDLAISSSRVMAVKSAPEYNSESLKHEMDVLSSLSDSENVIKCFGDSVSFENGERLYNVFLEYASNGSLYDRVRRNGERLGEDEVRSLTRSVLRGLKDVHSNGFVHCDVKLQNILLCSENSQNGAVVAKIADFGLAKKQSQNRVSEFRGTPMYMAPETLTKGELESPADVWALGCAVVEMLTGSPAWKNESNIASLFLKISKQSPELPENLSPEIRDFLEKCFIRNSSERWTAEMLLEHYCIAAVTLNSESSKKSTISPRCPFDFPELITPSPISQSGFDSWTEQDDSSTSVPAARFRHLVTDQVPNWMLSDNWLAVR